jgi:hypothetical protein
MAFTRNGNDITLNVDFSISYKDHVTTVPPTGMHKVKNIYWNPETGNYDVEHEDTPQE